MVLTPPTFYHAVIKVLPKVNKPTKTWQYRPISLINTDQKIFSHVISNRLKTLLNIVIRKEQYAYLSNRNINNAINYTKMIVDKLMDNTAVVALDFSKAFDRVDRNYMYMLLERIKCPTNIISSIKSIYSNTSSFIEVNGFLSRPVFLERGVRQGCPLSALLFILALEPMLDMIRKNKNIKSCSSRKVNAYADDVSAYINHSSVEELFQTVEYFCDATQFLINIDKSEIMSNKEVPGYQISSNIKILGIKHFIDNRASNPMDVARCIDTAADSFRICCRDMSMRAKAININIFICSKILHYARHNFMKKTDIA
jgi:hypothetical protein